MLSNAYFLAKFRFDTAENEPAKNLQNFKFSKNAFSNMHFRKMHFRRPRVPDRGVEVRLREEREVVAVEVGEDEVLQLRAAGHVGPEISPKSLIC